MIVDAGAKSVESAHLGGDVQGEISDRLRRVFGAFEETFSF